MMFLKLDCFCPSTSLFFLFFSFFLWKVELEILFFTYFIRHTCWFLQILLDIHVGLTPLHLNKNRKWAEIFWVKTLMFFHNTLSTKMLLTNPNDNLRNRCLSKTIFGNTVFQLLFELTFFLKLSWLLNGSIRSDDSGYHFI